MAEARTELAWETVVSSIPVVVLRFIVWVLGVPLVGTAGPRSPLWGAVRAGPRTLQQVAGV